MTLFNWRHIGRAVRKIVLHHRGPRLHNPEVRTNVVHHLLDVDGTHTAQRVGLHILVQQLIMTQETKASH